MKISFSLRLLDFTLILFVILTLSRVVIRVNPYLVSVFFSFWASLLLSLLLGVVVTEVINIEKIIFIYKFMMPVLLYLSLTRVSLTENEVHQLVRISFIVFFIMSLWVFIYIYLTSSGIIVGNSRVSFPLSNYRYSDAHLYSSYLSLSVLFFIMIKNKIKYSKLFIYATIFIGIVATILTGSRTGVVVLFSGFLVLLFYNFSGIRIIKYFIFLTFSTLIMISIVTFLPEYYEQINALNSRAFSFNISNDDSVSIRYLSLLKSIEESAYTSYLLGVGILSSSSVWYDGLISTLIANSGFIGLFFFFSFIVLFLISLYKKRNKYSVFSIILLVIYIGVNLITEYLLTTRGSFMIVIYLFLLHWFMVQIDSNRIKTRKIFNLTKH
jgi:hypothetical protein